MDRGSALAKPERPEGSPKPISQSKFCSLSKGFASNYRIELCEDRTGLQGPEQHPPDLFEGLQPRVCSNRWRAGRDQIRITRRTEPPTNLRLQILQVVGFRLQLAIALGSYELMRGLEGVPTNTRKTSLRATNSLHFRMVRMPAVAKSERPEQSPKPMFENRASDLLKFVSNKDRTRPCEAFWVLQGATSIC